MNKLRHSAFKVYNVLFVIFAASCSWSASWWTIWKTPPCLANRAWPPWRANNQR